MTSQQVLQRVLEHAHARGYRLRNTALFDYHSVRVQRVDEATGEAQVLVQAGYQTESATLNLRLLLYEVAFAQALFGDFWETHLNLLAASNDPLEYLMLYLANTSPATFSSSISA